MNSKRWSYQVVEVKPTFWGHWHARVQATLTQLGQQGWELVNAVQSHWYQPVVLILKKEL